MQNTQGRQEGDGSHVIQTSNAYDPYDPQYQSDFSTLLAAQNASGGFSSLSPSTTFSEHLGSSPMLSNPSTSDYGPFDPMAFQGIPAEQTMNQQFQSLLSLNDGSTFNFDGSAATLNQPQNMGVQQFGMTPNQTGHVPSQTIMPSVETPMTFRGQQSMSDRDFGNVQRPQASPATLGSSSPGQLISPIVRVESYENGPHSALTMEPSKARAAGRQSSNHLSPFPNSDYSSDEDNLGNQASPPTAVSRNADGSWRANSSGQKGLNPYARDGDLQVPSLDELAKGRERDEKNDQVQQWLVRSDTGGRADGQLSPPSPYPQSYNRPRAKSTNDVSTYHNRDDSKIPGPGAYLNVPSDQEDEDASSSGNEPESPPANVASSDRDPFPVWPSEENPEAGSVPWVDPPSRVSTGDKPTHPATASAAISRFTQRAKDIESASIAATLASSRRRNSESDMGSVRTMKGISKEVGSQPKEKTPFMNNFLGKITPRRTPSNQRKRKPSMPDSNSQVNLQANGNGTAPQREPTLTQPTRMGSWSRRSPSKLDTSNATLNPPGISTNTLSPSTPWGEIKDVIRRKRSNSHITRPRGKSDAGRSPGLGELMERHGGPPMPKLASTGTSAQEKLDLSDTAVDVDDDSDGDSVMLNDSVTMDLSVRPDPVIPTQEGFKNHAEQLNPRMPEYLRDRITQEQIKRYKRLVDFKVKHTTAVNHKNCASKGYCLQLGGESKPLKPKTGNKVGDSAFSGFQIIRPGVSAEIIERESNGTIIAATFPSGVPLPPVERLPAEFECPLCFKVKKFYKPSDWTKHVHEDVQPFTCTFEECNEPKSFKRKADWVRHENERHRQLEKWTCDIGECLHVCYRKDNFLQHLVREHKIPEPKGRGMRAGIGSSKSPITPLDQRALQDQFGAFSGSPNSAADGIWAIVDRCRRDTSKQPQDEPCPFCHNICNSWKKLTVHLAKHMEQISMPILPSIKQRHVDPDMGVLPGQAPVITQPAPMTTEAILSASPTAIAMFPADEPGTLDLNDPSISSSISLTPHIAVNGTYPPPQMWNNRYQTSSLQPDTSGGTLPQDMSYATRSFPGPMPASGQHLSSGQASYSSTDANASVAGSAPGSQQQYLAMMGHQQTYNAPGESLGYGDGSFSSVNTAYMMSTGQGESNSQGYQFDAQNYNYTYGSSSH